MFRSQGVAPGFYVELALYISASWSSPRIGNSWSDDIFKKSVLVNTWYMTRLIAIRIAIRKNSYPWNFKGRNLTSLYFILMWVR
jgi:hypothetical protein